jgi:hypothetical protein
MSAADIASVLGDPRRTNTPKPVELLRDGRGIYGVGETGSLDDQVLRYEPWRPDLLILRPPDTNAVVSNLFAS